MTIRTILGFSIFVITTILLAMIASIAPNDYFGTYVDALLGNASFPDPRFTLLLIAIALFYNLAGYLIMPKRLPGRQLVAKIIIWLCLYCCYMVVLIWTGRPIYFGGWFLRDWLYAPFLIFTSITSGFVLRVFSEPDSRRDIVGFTIGILMWGLQNVGMNWLGHGLPESSLLSKIIFITFPLASLLLGSALLAIGINSFRNVIREFRGPHLIPERTI